MNRLTVLVNEALDRAERDVGDRHAQRVALAWLRTWRKMREEERLDAGPAVHLGVGR